MGSLLHYAMCRSSTVSPCDWPELPENFGGTHGNTFNGPWRHWRGVGMSMGMERLRRVVAARLRGLERGFATPPCHAANGQ